MNDIKQQHLLVYPSCAALVSWSGLRIRTTSKTSQSQLPTCLLTIQTPT
jgi:hypothetical protein